MRIMTVPCSGFLVFIAYIFVFTFSVVPSYLDLRVHENIGLNLPRILIGISVVAYFGCFVLSATLREKLKLVISKNRFILFFLCSYFFLRVCSFFYNPSGYSLLLLINEALMNLFIVLFFSTLFFSIKNIRRVIIYSIFGAFLVAIFVFFEAFMEWNFFSEYADESTAAGMIAAEAKYRDGWYRSQGTFEHPLALAQYFLVLFPMFFSRYVFSRSRYVIIFMMITFFMAAYLARVRTFYVALMLGATFYYCVVFIWTDRIQLNKNIRLKLVLIFSPIVVFCASYKLYDLLFFGSSAELSSTMARFGQLNNGIIGIFESPFLGHGIGSSKEVIVDVGLYNPRGMIIWNKTIDSFYLGLALDSGIPALICYLMIFISSMASGISIYKNKNEYFIVRIVALSLSTSLLCAFVSMMVLSIFTILPFVFVLIGLICALSTISVWREGGDFFSKQAGV